MTSRHIPLIFDYEHWPPLRKAHTSAAVTGALAIISGFAVFVLWWEQSESTPQQFAAILAAAGLLSLVFELLRGQIEGHEERWRLSGILVTFVLLVIFELCVMGLHSAVGVVLSKDPRTRVEIVHAILGERNINTVGFLNLAVITGLWLVLAVVVAYRLAGTVHSCAAKEARLGVASGKKTIPDFLGGALSGLLAGGLAGPAAVMLYVLCARLVNEYVWMVNDHQGWKIHLHTAQEAFGKWHFGPISGVFSLSFMAIDFVDDLLMKVSARWGPALLIVIAALCIWGLAASAMKKKLRWGWIPLCALLLIFGYPLLTNFGNLFRLAFLVAIGWGGTGFILGALIPWLRKPSEHPGEWGIVAFVAAAIMFLVTIFSWSLFWPRIISLILTLFFIVAGFGFRRSAEVDRYWPVLALSVAAIIFGLTRTEQTFEFVNIQRQAYFLAISKPLTFSDATLAMVRAAPTNQLEEMSRLALMPQTQDLSLFQRFLRTPAFDSERRKQISAAIKKVGDELKLQQKELDELEQDKPGRQLERLPGAVQSAAQLLAQIRDVQARLNTGIQESERQLASIPKSGNEANQDIFNSFGLRGLAGDLSYYRSNLKSMSQLETQQNDLVGELQRLPGQVEFQQLLSKRLELSLTTSLGFWVTIGLLASWSLCRQKEPNPSESPESGP